MSQPASGFARALGALREAGVDFVVVRAGGTPMTAHLQAVPAVTNAFLEQTPLGRMVTLEDVTQAVLWLASDDAS